MGYLDERAAAALRATAPQTKAADYDRFWDETLAQARALPADFRRERSPYPGDYVRVWAVTYNGFGGQRIQGWLVIPEFAPKPCPCIVYSSFDWGGFVEYAMSNEIGADAYVTKNADSSVLITALNEVSHGRHFIQGDIIDRFLMVRQAVSGLTRTEQQLFDLACAGKSNTDIAAELGKSVRTVENYLGRIYDKFGVTTRQELLQLRGRE